MDINTRNTTDYDDDIIKTILKEKGFESLTKTQTEAFDAGVLDSNNSLLIAETGNGKTLCAEVFMYKHFGTGSIAYLVPSRQLVTEKIEQFSEWVPRHISVGQSFSDDIVVKTFESFYWSYISSGQGKKYGAIVFDDFHEMYSESRGVGIEKALTMAKNTDASILGMSATIGNAEEIADWMNADCIISESQRGVPVTEHPIEVDDSYSSRGEQISHIIDQNIEKAPFLVFVYQRSWTESRAKRIADSQDFSNTDIDFVSKIDDVLPTKLTSTYEKLGECMNNGVAFHHSGLEQSVRELIVSAVHDGDVSCVCSTTGLAYGFDAPIQSVLVTDFKRYNGFMGVHEYVQMIGRAGRTGYGYEKGYAFPLWKHDQSKSRFQFDTVAQEKTLEPIESHISSDELSWFVLELIVNGWTTKDAIKHVLEESFYANQMDTPRLLTHDLQRTCSWLTANNLIESPMANAYHETAFGESAIEFNHASFTSISPQSVVSIRNELLNTQKLYPEDLIQLLSNEFWFCELRNDATPDDPTLDKQLLEHNYADEHEVGIICWEWCTGTTIDKLEEKYDIDPTTIPRLANEFSTYVSAIGDLLERDPALQKPEWIDTFASQCRYGVATVDVDLLEQTHGVGRQTYSNLKEYIYTFAGGHNATLDSTIGGLNLLNDDYSPEIFKDKLMNNVGGVGPKTAERLLTYTRSTENRAIPDVPFKYQNGNADSIQRIQPSDRNSDDDDDNNNDPDDNSDSTQTSLTEIQTASSLR